MKKIIFSTGLFALLLGSCAESDTSQEQKSAPLSLAGLELQMTEHPEWTYENLRLYPICADENALKVSESQPTLATLAEGMHTPGFRITERKQFGREQNAWYNALTVQNKSDKTIFLMSGDVVTGGNQDRVIAYDDVIPPGSIKNIDVFCVEAGRSSYYNPEAPENEKQIAAFRGYYNVASPRVRKAVHQGNQQGVWSAVDKVTEANDASSATKTYAALETENAHKNKREGYLNFFEGKMDALPNAVGVVAVCNGKVIGVDIFSQPDLFRNQYKALLHGYTAEAVVAENGAGASNDPAVRNAFRQVARLAQANPAGEEIAGKFSIDDTWVHLFLK
ncbi:MAG: hypothetical protein H6574_23700 [Lewinellaceae bacterium]|nr:hypothetical protein [Saprospiraceae bacterium]MCB9334070.1 hypothetical protein [Lewinellaceae bacterium]